MIGICQSRWSTKTDRQTDNCLWGRGENAEGYDGDATSKTTS